MSQVIINIIITKKASMNFLKRLSRKAKQNLLGVLTTTFFVFLVVPEQAKSNLRAMDKKYFNLITDVDKPKFEFYYSSLESLTLDNNQTLHNQNEFTRKIQKIVDQEITDSGHLFQPNRKYNQHLPLIHLHIGKTGGTTFDHFMPKILKNLQLKNPLSAMTWPTDKKYVGFKHFDME